MNGERIEESGCLHPMYSQEGPSPDPPIPLLPVSGTESLCGTPLPSSAMEGERRDYGSGVVLPFLQPLFISVNPASLFFPDTCPYLVYLGALFPVSPRREKV